MIIQVINLPKQVLDSTLDISELEEKVIQLWTAVSNTLKCYKASQQGILTRFYVSNKYFIVFSYIC